MGSGNGPLALVVASAVGRLLALVVMVPLGRGLGAGDHDVALSVDSGISIRWRDRVVALTLVESVAPVADCVGCGSSPSESVPVASARFRPWGGWRRTRCGEEGERTSMLLLRVHMQGSRLGCLARPLWPVL